MRERSLETVSLLFHIFSSPMDITTLQSRNELTAWRVTKSGLSITKMSGVAIRFFLLDARVLFKLQFAGVSGKKAL